MSGVSPGKRGERNAQLFGEIGNDRKPRDALFRFITADDLLRRAQQGSQFVLRKPAFQAELTENIAEFHRYLLHSVFKSISIIPQKSPIATLKIKFIKICHQTVDEHPFP